MVNVTSTGKYRVGFRVFTGTSAGKLHLEDEHGTNLIGHVTVPGFGGWQNWTTVNAATINLTAGTHTLKIAMDRSGYNVNEIIFTQSVPVPAVPKGLTATSGNANVLLSWTASSGATSYKVYRGTITDGKDAYCKRHQNALVL